MQADSSISKAYLARASAGEGLKTTRKSTACTIATGQQEAGVAAFHTLATPPDSVEEVTVATSPIETVAIGDDADTDDTPTSSTRTAAGAEASPVARFVMPPHVRVARTLLDCGERRPAIYLVHVAPEGETATSDSTLMVLKTVSRLDVDAYTQLMHELGVSLTLQHPNLLTIEGTLRHDTWLGLFLPYFRNGDLTQYMQRRPLPEHIARVYFAQLLSALELLHSMNVLHRDLKPQNVLVSDDGSSVVLCDLGLSIAVGSRPVRTSAGTPSYVAPEVVGIGTVGGGTNYHFPADIWSLGGILHYMLTGGRPFKGTTESELYGLLRQQPYTPPAHLSASAQSLLVSMLRRHPKRRATIEQIKAHPWLAGCLVTF